MNLWVRLKESCGNLHKSRKRCKVGQPKIEIRCKLNGIVSGTVSQIWNLKYYLSVISLFNLEVCLQCPIDQHCSYCAKLVLRHIRLVGGLVAQLIDFALMGKGGTDAILYSSAIVHPVHFTSHTGQQLEYHGVEIHKLQLSAN